MASFHSHKRATALLALSMFWAAVAMISAPGSIGCESAHASDTAPFDYCYQTEVTITYNGTGTVTNQLVRVERDNAGLIATDQLDPRLWDVYVSDGAFGNEGYVWILDDDSTAAGWWFLVDSISAGETKTFTVYSGSGEQRRNQGVISIDDNFGAAGTVTNDAALHRSDLLQVDLVMELTDFSLRDEVIVDKWNSNQGYRIRIDQIISDNYLSWDIEGQSCTLQIQPSWTGRQFYRFVYDFDAGNDMFIYRNGSLAQSCDYDAASVTHISQQLRVATEGSDILTGAVIHYLSIGNSSTGELSAAWDFQARRSDFQSVGIGDIYNFTIEDLIGSNDMAWSFTQDQDDFSTAVGATELVTGNTITAIATSVPDVLGPAFGISDNAESTSGLFYSNFVDKWASAAPVKSFGYAVVLGVVGLIFGLAAYKISRGYTPLALFVFGMPFALGVANGWIPAWFMILWIILVIGGWYAQRHTELA